MPLKVVAIGVRGSYSVKRFTDNKQKLINWLAKDKKYEIAGTLMRFIGTARLFWVFSNARSSCSDQIA